MSKRDRSRPHGRGAAARQEKREQVLPWSVRLRSTLDGAPDLLLHSSPPEERPWRFLLPVLALAFVARAAIALSGDFVLHPDEIMQYLEPAHRSSLRQRRNLLGVLLRCPFVVGARVGRWRLEAVRPRRSWSAFLGTSAASSSCFARFPCSFRRACTFLPGGTLAKPAARVALLMGAFWYELGRFCPQADDRVCRHGPDWCPCSRSVCGLRRTNCGWS